MAETVPPTRRGFMVFSPIRDIDKDKENDVPVLSLVQFSKPPFVTFGSVKLGSSKSAVLRVENVTECGEADVLVEKISSAKGFSVERNRFIVEPEGFCDLTITWTPVEEGGIREVIVFNANGILRHQAVLLGRAEAPKKKKKSLWDSIKKKGAGDPATPRRQKTKSSLKISANKTFQVSRQPQYKQQKHRSPLAQLNKAGTVRETSLSKHSPVKDHLENLEQQVVSRPSQRQRSLGLIDQNVPGNAQNVQKNSHLIPLEPAVDLVDCVHMSGGSGVLVTTPEHRDLARVMNTTLSPIGTPERLKNLMPRIQSVETPESVVKPTVPKVCDRVQQGKRVPSVREALAFIGSDLTQTKLSPTNIDWGNVSSDSLESTHTDHGCESSKPSFNALPDCPVLEPNEPRLTFFVSKKTLAHQVLSVQADVDDAAPKLKKTSFTTTTVIKSKAPVILNCPSGRRIKKSRRRLLEKTLELSDGSSQFDSSQDTPGLPVIESDGNSQVAASPFSVRQQTQEWVSISLTPPVRGRCPTPVISPIYSQTHSPAIIVPSPISFPPSPGLSIAPAVSPPPSANCADVVFTVTSPPLSPTLAATATSPVPLVSSSPFHHEHSSNSSANRAPLVASTPLQVVSAPKPYQSDIPCVVQTKAEVDPAVNSKKRKSDEFLRVAGKVDNIEKSERVKRSRVAVVVKEPKKPAMEKRRSVSQSQKQQPRAPASVRSASSVKTAKPVPPAQSKQPSSKPPSRGGSSLKSFGMSAVKTAKVVAVAQSKLVFIKPTQTAIPRHPMPFAAKNMFYDERWITKQETGFTCWLNYILTPDDFKVSTEVTKVNAVSLAMGADDKFNVPRAPTKEEVSFSAYTARRRLNRLRRSACQLFTSEAMAKAIKRLELEVEAKRLLIRKDRHLWKDIGERQKVLNWLLSYNPLWLRIGLETIYGELISLESNSDVTGLAMFILRRLLWNPDIAAEYRHAKVPNLYKDGHEEALSRFTLKKLLLLVCFLDKAKGSRLIDHDPCLFCMDAEFKATRDLLLAFSRDFLSGEGILPRHLGYLGLPVSHVQTPLDEFNFAVKNLAVDLRCGIRLVRVMELFIQDWSLSQKLRLPAISRLQKIHNVDLALRVLTAKGVDLKDEQGSVIDSRDIVEGHREKTLSLLWKIIFAFQVEVILDEEQLRDEVCFLKRTLRVKQRLASLRADKSIEVTTMSPRAPFKHASAKITLLMDWVTSVCNFYNLMVDNFTVSFSDGRVLCYLIHHYHPSHLPEEAISQCTTQTVECAQRGRVELDCSSSDSDSSFNAWPTEQKGTGSPSVEFKELLENEKQNFRQVNTAVSFLGGVPAMINPADMSNTIPSEKVVMAYLSFLCARLLDLRNETRAARVIQEAWRKYRLKKDLEIHQVRHMAAAKIQLLVKAFLKRRRAKRQSSAALMIQAAWRGFLTRRALRLKKEADLQALRHSAATVIQAQWRMYFAMRVFQRLRYYAIVVQAQWRMKRAASAYRKSQWAASVIQKYVKALSLARREREQYILLRAATVKLQRVYRKQKAQRLERQSCAARVIQTAFRKWSQQRLQRRTEAALKIESWYRMHRCMSRYTMMKSSAVLIQAQYRGYMQRKAFHALRLQWSSALIIQSAYRGHKARKMLEKEKLASVIIQRWFRACVKRDMERQTFVTMRSAAITIQAAYRGHVVRRSLKEQHQAATVIQTALRAFVAQRRYLSLRKAAAVVQQQYRAKLLGRKIRLEYEALRLSATTLQAVWRGRAVRKRVEKLHQCATIIQAHYRRHKKQTEYRSAKAAALVIQQQFRAHRVGKATRTKYLQVKAAAVTLQAAYRGMRARKELKRSHQAATVIQSVVRMSLCRKRYMLLQSAAIIIQSRYKALIEGKKQQQEYKQLRQAAVTLQAAYRGFQVRKDLRRQHQAATVIQAWFRMYKVRTAYLASKSAAIILQERYRAKRLRDQQLQKYRAIKIAARVIQAAYRGHRARLELAVKHKAATVIQRQFLTFVERKCFLAIRAAALVCQRRYRAVVMARKVQSHYLFQRKAAITLQAAYRGMKVRQQFRAKHTAATTIQAHVRMHLQRKLYKKLQWAARTVQERYRANKKMREEIEALKTKKQAAVALQAAFRGMKLRQSLKQKRQAAVIIQSAYRGHKARKMLEKEKLASVVIQRWFRACVRRDTERQTFVTMRSAAITIQAAYRGHVVRRSLKEQHQAATVIQTALRAFVAQRRYLSLRKAATVVQQQYRAKLLGRKIRLEYEALRLSVTTLQAVWRGRAVRKRVEKLHQCATIIQAYYRRHKKQTEYRSAKAAALVIQQRFRAHKVGREMKTKYLQVKAAAVTLQAAYRGMRARKELKKSHQAATVIQSVVRMSLCRKRYMRLQTAVIIIQRYYKALIESKKQQQEYKQLRHAAVMLQAAYRGFQVRKDLRRQHQAATVIQAWFKMHKVRTAYLASKSAAIILQDRYRAKKLRDQQMQKYRAMKTAARVIQAAYRGHRARLELAVKHKAATVIQRQFLTFVERKRFLAIRAAALVCQRRYRAVVMARKVQSHYLFQRKAAITLQAAYRGMKVRQHYRAKHTAATTIQAHVRMHLQKKLYNKLQWAARTVQERYRANKKMREEMEALKTKKQAAVALQAAFRGMKLRQSLKQKRQAAVIIQSAYRGHKARKMLEKEKLASVVIQRWFRACVRRDTERQAFVTMRSAAITIQAAYRGHVVRRSLKEQHQAATVIQTALRAFVAQRRYLSLRKAATVVQQQYRAKLLGRKIRLEYEALRLSATTLQAVWRGRAVRKRVEKLHQCATIVQAHYRRHKKQTEYRSAKAAALVIQQRFRAHKMGREMKTKYLQVKAATVTLQAAYRGMRARKELKKSHHAATVIQSVVRMSLCRKRYMRLLRAAIIIQSRYKALIESKKQQQEYKYLRQAAVTLQAAYRGMKLRQRIKNEQQAALVIQRAYRAHCERKQYLILKSSTLALQRRYRACVQKRQERDRFLRMKQSAIILQAAYRGWSDRREIVHQCQAATTIQCCWRGSVQRRAFQKQKMAAVILQRRMRSRWLATAQRNNYIHMKASAITLQAHVRGWIARRQTREAARAQSRLRFSSAVFHHLSAIRIQRALRAHWALQSAKKQIHSVVTIQRWVRAWRQRRCYLEERRKVVTAQRAARRWLAQRHQAATVIQHAAKRFLLLRRQQRVQQGIIKAQALWRGHRSRTLNDNPKILRARHRLRKVSADVKEEDKLCNKTSSALDYLLRYKHFSHILEALKNLEIATRLSPECCERLVESGATQVIFTLIRSCNRSVPCMEIITYSIQILLNLSKYHKTVEAVYGVENSVETLLDLLQIYREKAGDKVADKGGSIFTKACFLLALLLQDNKRALEVRKLPKVLDRIQSIFRLTARKHKMDVERTITKQKMNGSFLLQSTPLKSKSAPKFAPDWVLRKDKLKDIVDPLRAIQMVANAFGIVL